MKVRFKLNSPAHILQIDVRSLLQNMFQLAYLLVLR
jgi:hypothetical protein